MTAGPATAVASRRRIPGWTVPDSCDFVAAWGKVMNLDRFDLA